MARSLDWIKPWLHVLDGQAEWSKEYQWNMRIAGIVSHGVLTVSILWTKSQHFFPTSPIGQCYSCFWVTMYPLCRVVSCCQGCWILLSRLTVLPLMLQGFSRKGKFKLSQTLQELFSCNLQTSFIHEKSLGLGPEIPWLLLGFSITGSIKGFMNS